jgi:SAM-dependent methyltransferase
MQKIYQRDWFGIPFTALGPTSAHRLADVGFYERFYDELHRRHAGFEDLPATWRSTKIEVAKTLFELTGSETRLASIGCGLGYVERELARLRGPAAPAIVAVEPSRQAARWLAATGVVEVVTGLFPAALAGRAFDVVIACNIDYCFDASSYDAFLRRLQGSGYARFVFADMIPPSDLGAGRRLRATVKQILAMAGVYHPGQFWGYLRTPEEHAAALELAGFELIGHGRTPGAGHWIEARPVQS